MAQLMIDPEVLAHILDLPEGVSIEDVVLQDSVVKLTIEGSFSVEEEEHTLSVGDTVVVATYQQDETGVRLVSLG